MAKIVEATGTASRRSHVGAAIEKAMSDVVLKAYAEGIHDPDKIRDLKLAARAAVNEAARKTADKAAKK